MAPHVSEESMVLKVLERLRFLRGPLLVECGRSLFSQREIAKMRRRPDVDTHKFPSSYRRQRGATVILSSHVDPVDLHGAQFWYSFNSRRCLGKQPARHSVRVARALARALAELLQQERIETHMRGILPTYDSISCTGLSANKIQSW